jgi:CDP-4-dehydro-6-deoxyglucose reductase, E1
MNKLNDCLNGILKIKDLDIGKKDKELRKIINCLVESHYNLVHKNKNKFRKGQSRIYTGGRVYNSQEMKNLVSAGLDFWLTSGRFANKFEKEFCHLLKIKHCILTNSGSSANLLAVSALTSLELKDKRLKSGDEVITTACSFPTTVAPIVQNNLVPVFLDVNLGTYNIKSNLIENAISKKTKAIFIAHTLGNPFDLDTIKDIAQKYKLWLIEDNCDALGSRYNDKYTGTFGHLATFSFYPAHHITMGEGGAIVTNNHLLKKILLSFRDWGRHCWCETGQDNTCKKRFSWQMGSLPFGYDHKYIYSHFGYNLKITDMQAAISVAQLKKFEKLTKIRERNWKLLNKGLKKYKEFFILPDRLSKSQPSWFGFPITVKENKLFKRDDIIKFLENKNISTRLLFSGNLIRQPCFRNVKHRVFEDLKNTDYIMKNTFWIGNYPGITEKMIDYVLLAFEDFIGEKEK